MIRWVDRFDVGIRSKKKNWPSNQKKSGMSERSPFIHDMLYL